MISIRFLLPLFLLIFIAESYSQKLVWNTELDYFFDNTEFTKSNLTIDQTMSAVVLNQELGWEFEQNHRIIVGFDVAKISGSNTFIDDAHFLSYYQYNDQKTLLNLGVFKRGDLLDDYSNLLFQDSVAYYKHTMEGIYLKRGDDRQFFKLWLDWTGFQTPNQRESFFIGASFHKSLSNRFYTNFQSYLFHFATTSPNPLGQSVSDNLLSQLSVGYQLKDYLNLDKINLSAGVLAGYERDRRASKTPVTPLGVVLQADVAVKGFGMNNLFYLGQKRMNYYPEYGNQLYWSNPFLRERLYLQNKLYWNFLDTANVTGQIAMRTHLSEGKVFFEQLLVLRAHINGERSVTSHKQ